MVADVVVLNGGSSAGKTSIGRALQELMPRPWLLIGVDDLIDVAPASLISYGPDGEVLLGDQWRAVETPGRGASPRSRAAASA